MSPILYALNIGTLAAWLSVAGFGTVGIVIPVTREILASVERPDPYKDLESTIMTDPFTGEELLPSQETDTGQVGEADEDEAPLAEEETLPTPPEMPEDVETTPLPEIPDMPPPAAAPAPTPAPAPT
ncbi:MAG: hypothetical protein EOP85_21360, partial [Verrucomicrobiaceae bacterium]